MQVETICVYIDEYISCCILTLDNLWGIKVQRYEQPQEQEQ